METGIGMGIGVNSDSKNIILNIKSLKLSIFYRLVKTFIALSMRPKAYHTLIVRSPFALNCVSFVFLVFFLSLCR